MPDLLPPRNLISTRGHHQRRSSVRRASSDPLPSPAASKEFFVAIRSMAYGDKLTTNLSRAVVQIIRQSESAGWENEADDYVEVVDAWQVEPSEHERRHELQFNKSRMPDELTTRLASILRDAEYEGRLPDVIKSFDELVAAGIASKDKTTLGSFLDHARRLARIGQTDAALDIIFDQIDEMLLAGEFDRVNQLLIDATTDDYSVELLLGILTATLPARTRLPYRNEFFQRVANTLQARGELKDGLLVGLD